MCAPIARQRTDAARETPYDQDQGQTPKGAGTSYTGDRDPVSPGAMHGNEIKNHKIVENMDWVIEGKNLNKIKQ